MDSNDIPAKPRSMLSSAPIPAQSQAPSGFPKPTRYP